MWPQFSGSFGTDTLGVQVPKQGGIRPQRLYPHRLLGPYTMISGCPKYEVSVMLGIMIGVEGPVLCLRARWNP